jgi:hypothetical protein
MRDQARWAEHAAFMDALTAEAPFISGASTARFAGQADS